MTRRPARPTRHTRDQRVERKAELLDAAIRVIRRDGAAGASMDAIAAEVGVTKPIIYRYFGDRDGVAAAVAERMFGELMVTLSIPLESGAEDKAVLRSTLDAFVGFVEADTEVYRYLVRTPNPREGLGFIARLGAAISVVLGDRMRARGVDSGAAEPWAHALIGMCQASVDWWIDRRTISRDTLVDYLVALVWDGMGTETPTLPLIAPLTSKELRS